MSSRGGRKRRRKRARDKKKSRSKVNSCEAQDAVGIETAFDSILDLYATPIRLYARETSSSFGCTSPSFIRARGISGDNRARSLDPYRSRSVPFPFPRRLALEENPHFPISPPRMESESPARTSIEVSSCVLFLAMDIIAQTWLIWFLRRWDISAIRVPIREETKRAENSQRKFTFLSYLLFYLQWQKVFHVNCGKRSRVANILYSCARTSALSLSLSPVPLSYRPPPFNDTLLSPRYNLNYTIAWAIVCLLTC